MLQPSIGLFREFQLGEQNWIDEVMVQLIEHSIMQSAEAVVC